ncbi:MAG: HutD family protein [Pseudoxanthomonas suwonensis]|nr:HutD family protein [Pseudoxanthomonas suwonensis]
MDDVADHWVRLEDTPRSRWKNGLGLTRELMAGPGSHDWDWRLSIAEIDRDADYSPFPGCARWQWLLAGDGLDLDGPGTRQSLCKPFQCIRFDGGMPVRARLSGGPVRVLNLIWWPCLVTPSTRVRRLRPGAGVRIARQDPVLVHALAGQVRIRGALGTDAHAPGQGDTLLLVPRQDGAAASVCGDGTVLLVRLQPVSGVRG